MTTIVPETTPRPLSLTGLCPDNLFAPGAGVLASLGPDGVMNLLVRVGDGPTALYGFRTTYGHVSSYYTGWDAFVRANNTRTDLVLFDDRNDLRTFLTNNPKVLL